MGHVNVSGNLASYKWCYFYGVPLPWVGGYDDPLPTFIVILVLVFLHVRLLNDLCEEGYLQWWSNIWMWMRGLVFDGDRPAVVKVLSCT